MYRHTNLLLGLLVALAGLDGVLGSLGLGDGFLNSQEPSVTLSAALGFEGVLVAGELESEGKGAVLSNVGSIGLVDVSNCAMASLLAAVLTKFRTPAGCSFLSACLTKKRRPFPVWLDQATTG